MTSKTFQNMVILPLANGVTLDPSRPPGSSLDNPITIHGDSSADESTIWIADSSYEEDDYSDSEFVYESGDSMDLSEEYIDE